MLKILAPIYRDSLWSYEILPGMLGIWIRKVVGLSKARPFQCILRLSWLCAAELRRLVFPAA
jgi:hypothetical protein